MFVRRVTKTDNKSVANKVFLRRKATEYLPSLRVLDLYAGKNICWRSIDKERYYGVELKEGKGKNLYADAKTIINSLDLSAYNVIDVDSYELPFEVCENLLKSDKVKSGTIIIYTAITNVFTQLSKTCIERLGITDMYKIAPSLFNLNALEYFYDMLASHGVNEVNYYEVKDKFIKHYGYFTIP
jgi:hypothetical protein